MGPSLGGAGLASSPAAGDPGGDVPREAWGGHEPAWTSGVLSAAGKGTHPTNTPEATPKINLSQEQQRSVPTEVLASFTVTSVYQAGFIAT